MKMKLLFALCGVPLFVSTALADECDDELLPFIFKGKLRSCGWVAAKPEKRCRKSALVERCPATCEAEGCGDGSTLSPTLASECFDFDDHFPAGRKDRTCEWVGRRERRCLKFGDFCPVTCGLCEGEEESLEPTPSPLPASSLHIATDKTDYRSGEAFHVTFVNSDPERKDWIGIYPRGSVDDDHVPSGPEMWVYACGTQHCAEKTFTGSVMFSKFQPEEGDWPLDDGEYEVVLVRNEWLPPYEVVTHSEPFVVSNIAPAPTPALTIGVLEPGDSGYAEAITTTNRFCHVRCPATVVQPANAEELAHWMRSDTNPFTVKGGGHSYSCQSVAADGGTLVDTSRLNSYEFIETSEGKTELKMGAGLRFIDVLPEVTERMFSMPHGECTTVGIAGYFLNNGNHPELGNLRRLYDTPYIKRIEGVTTRGSIIQVDENGVQILDSSATEDQEALQSSLIQALRQQTEDSEVQKKVAQTELELVQQYGANMMVATSITIELLPRLEPFFAHIVFDAAQVLEAGVLRDLFFFDEDSNDVDCGIIIETHYSSDIEVALLVKCVDWGDATGANILNVMNDYDWSISWEMMESKSSYFLWHASSHGLGWVPRTYIVALDEAVDVADIVIGHLADLTECANCFVEFHQYQYGAHLDYWCSDLPENKERCMADTANMHERIEESLGVPWFADPHLPNCEGDDWEVTGLFTHYSPFLSMSRSVARDVAEVWDEDDRLGFWMGAKDELPTGECDAGTTTPSLSDTCVAAGVTISSLAEIERVKYETLCPDVLNYEYFKDQNEACN